MSVRLITFQDKFVVDKIQFEKENCRPPIYINKINNFQDRERYLLNKFINVMKQTLGIPENKTILPIWCWVVKRNATILDDDYNELYDRSIPSCRNMVALDLEVPDDGVFISNFDVWREIFCNAKFERNISDKDFNQLFEKQKGATLQACIPLIHESFIKKVKKFTVDRDYSQTEEEIQKLLKNNEIELNDKGDIWQYKDRGIEYEDNKQS
jgi:hypothetical protein